MKDHKGEKHEEELGPLLGIGSREVNPSKT